MPRDRRQFRPVAVTAQVQLDEVPGEALHRPPGDSSGQFRRLLVRQVAQVTEDAIDQELRSAGSEQLHQFVVVVLQRQHVHAGEQLDQFGRPAPEVGGVPDGPRRVRAAVAAVDAERERGNRVVRYAERPAGEGRREVDDGPVGVLAGQTGSTPRVGKDAATRSRCAKCWAWAYQWDAPAPQIGERPVLPVVGVRVREDDGRHAVPRGADGLEAGGEEPRVQPAVDEQAEPVVFDQAGVPAATTGEHCKPGRHRGLSPRSCGCVTDVTRSDCEGKLYPLARAGGSAVATARGACEESRRPRSANDTNHQHPRAVPAARGRRQDAGRLLHRERAVGGPLPASAGSA